MTALGNTGIDVSPIGVGTWPMSGKSWGPTDDPASLTVLNLALDLGVNLIDTAESYGDGHAETLVGQVLAHRRADAIVATKVSHWNLSPRQLDRSLSKSCKRMQTDYVDLFFLHWPNPDISIADTLACMERFRASGRIRAIGVSNFTVADLKAASQYAVIDAIQPPYNLLWREIESDTLPYCATAGIGVISYSSLALGLLSGSLAADTVFGPEDERPSTVLFQPDVYPKAIEAIEALRRIARQYRKSVAQLAIQWLISRPGVSSALLGVREPRELIEDLGGVGWCIDESDLEEIDAATTPIWLAVAKYPDMFGRWRMFGSPRQP